MRREFWGQRAASPPVPASDSPSEAPGVRGGAPTPPPLQSCSHPDTYTQQENHVRSSTKKIKSEIQARFDAAHVAARYSQFGELLQVGQVLYVSDGVVLQEQMGEVGGKAQIAYV